MKIYGAQLTGSIASTGNPVVTGSLTVSGNLTAQQFIVSSSVTFLTTSFSSGSTKFGDSSDDTHQFTGSLSVTGSVATTGVATFLSSVSVNGGRQPLSNGIHTYFSSSISYIDSLQSGVAWRDLSIAGNDLFFKSGGIERMRINSTGNVGIGTTSPSALLETRVAVESPATNKIALIAATSNGANDIFRWYDGATQLGVFKNNGNVGIGTTSPVANDGDSKTFQLGNRLVVQNVIGTQFLIGTNAYYDGTWKYIAAAKYQAVRGTGESGAIQFHLASAGTAGGTITNMDGSDIKMIIKESGNVGIGTTSPSVKLDVNGQIKFNSIATTDYSISFSGIGAGAWFNIPEFNFNGFYGLATISIQNDNSSRGYTVRASAWIFQTGINGLDIYGTLRSVTIRPDGTSYEGLNVVESYHTAPSSGRYNMRMRLVVREAGLGAANPLNLQIWVDNTASFPASGTLLLKAI